jgi:uncharacterized membrane protein
MLMNSEILTALGIIVVFLGALVIAGKSRAKKLTKFQKEVYNRRNFYY